MKFINYEKSLSVAFPANIYNYCYSTSLEKKISMAEVVRVAMAYYIKNMNKKNKNCIS